MLVGLLAAGFAALMIPVGGGYSWAGEFNSDSIVEAPLSALSPIGRPDVSSPPIAPAPTAAARAPTAPSASLPPAISAGGRDASVAPAAPPSHAASSTAVPARTDAETSTPPSTTEIPSAREPKRPASAYDPAHPPGSVDTGPPSEAESSAVNQEIADYQSAGETDMLTANSIPQLHSLREFLGEMNGSSPIGVQVREDRCKLNNGEEVEGLAILSVGKNSPAAKAGLHAYHGAAHNVMEGVTVAAALFFPPAIIATALLSQSRIGESYDLIIGVDGDRVSNVIEFEDKMRDVKPGDIIYLSVVRHGARLQIPVSVPAT